MHIQDTALIDGYTDFEAIGSGGFSTVYRAHQERFDRWVAVKILDVELLDEGARIRFVEECRRAGRVSRHPNVVTVLDSGITSDGHPYITTDFMQGGSLADALEREGPLPVARVLTIGVKLCGALAAVHDAGIVHRDVKPENVLLSEYGEAHLTDFGIAVVSEAQQSNAPTSALRPVALTPVHAAPEILDGTPASPASDIYALGSSLYMLLAGSAPFEDLDENELVPLLRRILHDPVPPIKRGDVPEEITIVLRRALEKDPADRFASAVEFAAALQWVQAALGIPVSELVGPGARTTIAAEQAYEGRKSVEALTAGAALAGSANGSSGAVTAEGDRSRQRVLIAATAGMLALALVLTLIVSRRGSSTDAGAGTAADTSSAASDAAPGSPSRGDGAGGPP